MQQDSLDDPRLKDVAKHFVANVDLAVTSDWAEVQAYLASLGITFDQWQDDLNLLALARKDDGSLLCGEDGMNLSAMRQVGKALPVDTPILTPTGFRTMGALGVGDQVYAPSGEAVTITMKSPVMVDREVFRLTLTDGRQIDADGDHLWTVRDSRRNRWVTVTTREMFDAGTDRGSGERTVTLKGRSYRTREYRWQMPRQFPVQIPERDLPIDPYLFGAWLGDGTSVFPRLTSSVADSGHWVRVIRECGFVPSVRASGTGHSIGITGTPGPGHHARTLSGKLSALGVIGNKHIPEQYLITSPRQREALLQGLMDTDGHISEDGATEFTTTTHNLALGVLFLVRSLGWKASIHEGRAMLNGRDCGPKWRVTFKPDLSDGFSPFRMERKASRVREVTRAGTRTVSVRSIERVASVPVQCIAVDSADSLYLAGRELIPTHNSFDFGWLFFGVCMLRPNTLALWTAHRLATANETYRVLASMARSPQVRKLVSRIAKDHGNSGVIEFRNGSRIVFGSREGGFGLGWTKVDLLMLDEAQRLTEATIEDMVPATAASDIGLVILTGTPPRPSDRSEVFRHARTLALESPETFDGVWVELGAPDGWEDADDLEMLTSVNPAVRRGRVGRPALRRMLRRLKDKGSKLREVFGVWDAKRDTSGIDMADWDDTLADGSPDTGALAYAVNMDPDGYASIGVAARWPDGRMHVELVDSSYTPLGTGSLVSWLAERKKVPVALLRSSMTQQLEPQLRAAGVATTVATGNDFAVATSMLTTGIHEKTITHFEQIPLDVAVTSATTRPIGTVGGVAWDLSKQDVPMSPLVAVTLANWLAQSATPKRRRGVW